MVDMVETCNHVAAAMFELKAAVEQSHYLQVLQINGYYAVKILNPQKMRT